MTVETMLKPGLRSHGSLTMKSSHIEHHFRPCAVRRRAQVVQDELLGACGEALELVQVHHRR